MLRISIKGGCRYLDSPDQWTVTWIFRSLFRNLFLFRLEHEQQGLMVTLSVWGGCCDSQLSVDVCGHRSFVPVELSVCSVVQLNRCCWLSSLSAALNTSPGGVQTQRSSSYILRVRSVCLDLVLFMWSKVFCPKFLCRPPSNADLTTVTFLDLKDLSPDED